MCLGFDNLVQAQKLQFLLRKPRRTKLRVLRLSRRKKQEEEKVGNDMVVRNLKLYMKNMSIKEENDKLRKKAILLHQENLALMSELRRRFSNSDSGPIN